MSNTTGICGVIFLGGKSARMGINKGLLDFHGKPQREFLFELLNNFCDHVYTSCKHADNVPASLNPLPDTLELESPLNGIISAFRLHPSVAWLTVPVDMPFILDSTVSFLIQHRDTKKVASCFYDSEGNDPEPLFTLWEPRAHPLLEAHYRAGNRGIKPFLQHHDINLVKPPDPRLHQNINSKDELAAYLKDLRKG